MDKRKVFSAYQKGFINLHECAQILGIDIRQVQAMLESAQRLEPVRGPLHKRPVNH